MGFHDPVDLPDGPHGTLRALLIWPHMAGNALITTSLGRAVVFIATGITEAELRFAKRTSSAHLLLLLLGDDLAGGVVWRGGRAFYTE